MLRARYRTQCPIQFERCYKCSSTSGLSTESVGGPQPEAVFPGLAILSAPLAFSRVLRRESLSVPICSRCRLILLPFKFAFLLLFVAYLILVIYLFTDLAGLCGENVAVGIALISAVLLLFGYTYFRDTYQGVQIEQIKDEFFAFEYFVSKWCSEDFRKDYWRHRRENPRNSG